ncbi:hypothetical protein [Streptomyces luteireticuli]|uniref:hypothetical protein n=1 Tax=Streptomyces luteireticuli TaxID=173858 RepID=UPI0031E044F9
MATPPPARPWSPAAPESARNPGWSWTPPASASPFSSPDHDPALGVPAAGMGLYDFTSRTAKRHRTEIRELTGRHECSVTDQIKLASHLVDAIWHAERREDQVRSELYQRMHHDRTEPPTPDQVASIIPLRAPPGRRAGRRRSRRPPRAGRGLPAAPGLWSSPASPGPRADAEPGAAQAPGDHAR